MLEESEITYTMVIVFTILLAVMCVFFFILIRIYQQNLEKRQKEALRNLIIGQDNERERLSRDMHDQLGPQLNAIAMYADSIKTNDVSLRGSLDEIKEELWNSVKEVRNISHDLMSTSLRKYGLIEAIRKLIARNKSGLTIELESDTDAELLSDLQISNLYNIIKELVHNTNKHSKASKALIKFETDTNSKILSFTYNDNGIGNTNFNPKEVGIGLNNIRTRVKIMDGKVDFDMSNGFLCKIKFTY